MKYFACTGLSLSVDVISSYLSIGYFRDFDIVNAVVNSVMTTIKAVCSTLIHRHIVSNINNPIDVKNIHTLALASDFIQRISFKLILDNCPQPEAEVMPEMYDDTTQWTGCY